MTTANLMPKNINEIKRSDFRIEIGSEYREFTNEFDVLVASKNLVQNSLFGSNGVTEFRAFAGLKSWHWATRCGGVLKGVNGSRDWQCFKSFVAQNVGKV